MRPRVQGGATVAVKRIAEEVGIGASLIEQRGEMCLELGPEEVSVGGLAGEARSERGSELAPQVRCMRVRELVSAAASMKVDFPDPFSPTRNVMGVLSS